MLTRTAWQAARPFASKTDGKMGYEDFVYFILSEEAKTNNISLDYWFKCIDLDCDGCLRANEMLVHLPRRNLCVCCCSAEGWMTLTQTQTSVDTVQIDCLTAAVLVN